MIPTIIGAVVVAGLVIAIIVKGIIDKKKGKSSCSCGCQNCAINCKGNKEKQ